MTDLGAMIRAMREKGLACNVILDAVEAIADSEVVATTDKLEERRANDRARHARWRSAQKEKANANVSNAEQREQPLAEVPAPLVSPLLPSPRPLTNNPPIIPPSSEIEAREKPKRDPNGSRLSPDWELPEDWLSEARRIAFKAKTQLTDQEIRNEADKFRDHFAGSGGRKLDWLATWRNWIRTCIERRRPARHASGGGGAQSISQHGRGSIAAAAARREHERQNRTDVPGEFDWGDDVEGQDRWHGNGAVVVG